MIADNFNLLNGLALIAIGMIGFLGKRAISTLDKTIESMRADVQELTVKVAVLIDRDRHQRLADYRRNDAIQERRSREENT